MKIKEKNTRRSIKKLSLEDPKDIIIKCFLIFFLITLLTSYIITIIFSFLNFKLETTSNIMLTLIITSPLFLNLINIFLKNSKDELLNITDIFKLNKQSFKYIILFAKLTIPIFLIIKILNLIQPLENTINNILILLLIPILIIITLTYIEQKNIKSTIKLLKNNTIQFYGLILSFTPLYILGIFTLGILYIWLIPYTIIAITYFYQEKINNKKFQNQPSLSNPIIITISLIIILILITTTTLL